MQYRVLNVHDRLVVQSIAMSIGAVQRLLTGARHRRTCKMSMGRVAGIETELGIGANCPVQSMVRVSYDGIIGDGPSERLCEVCGTLRRHAYYIVAEGAMDGHNTDRSLRRKSKDDLPDELSQVNLNAAGTDVRASSHFVAVSESSAEEPVREFELGNR